MLNTHRDDKTHPQHISCSKNFEKRFNSIRTNNFRNLLFRKRCLWGSFIYLFIPPTKTQLRQAESGMVGRRMWVVVLLGRYNNDRISSLVDSLPPWGEQSIYTLVLKKCSQTAAFPLERVIYSDVCPLTMYSSSSKSVRKENCLERSFIIESDVYLSVRVSLFILEF